MARLPTLLVSTLVFLVLRCLVNAQDTASLPPCAKDCASTAATAVGCSLTDAPCLCKTKNFTNATLQCSAKVCTKEDQSSAIGVLASMCNSVTTTSSSTSSSTSTTTSSTLPTPSPPITTRGPPIPITSATSATSPSTPSSAPSSSSSSTPTTSTVPTTMTSGGTTLSIPPSTTIVLTTSTLGTVPTINAAAPGINTAEQIGAVGAVVLGMFALL